LDLNLTMLEAEQKGCDIAASHGDLILSLCQKVFGKKSHKTKIAVKVHEQGSSGRVIDYLNLIKAKIESTSNLGRVPVDNKSILDSMVKRDH
jgi:hypothetical protein